MPQRHCFVLECDRFTDNTLGLTRRRPAGSAVSPLLMEDWLSAPSVRYFRQISILFGASLFFLALHVLDDALSTGEPASYGVTIPEFLFYAGLVYLIVPPIGYWLVRRGRAAGLVILLLYGFQAMYGAGLNHIRHLYGDFGGSGALPRLLGLFGITVTDIRGYGFGSVLMGMAGLGQTPPHTHTLLSSLIAFVDIGLNAVLILVVLLALQAAWRARRPTASPVPAGENVRL